MKFPSHPIFAAAAAILLLLPSTSSAKSSAGRGTPQSTRPTLDLSNPGEYLRVPEQIHSNGRALKATFRYDALDYVGPAFDATIRAYNGQLPGPTLRVKPGEKLHLTLVNDLDGPTGNLANNEFQHPNYTNLHTHGPHITPEDPGDNVFIKLEESPFPGREEVNGKAVGPKQFHMYRYNIDGVHMPGTMWYHPHLHGSTALQATVASGMLIIDDPKDSKLPDIIKDMEEVQMLIYNLDLGSGQSGIPGSLESGGLREWSSESDDLLSDWKTYGFAETNKVINVDDSNVFLPNFQYQPKVQMAAGKWYRFRMVMSVTEASLVMGFEDGADCEMKLLAKDGIYVKNSDRHYAPRDISAIFLSPGNRADVAIRCNTAEVDVDMIQLARTDPGNDISAGTDFDPVLSPSDPQVMVFSMEIVPNNDGNDDELPASYELDDPCYLVDTLDVEPDSENVIFYEGRIQPMGIIRQGRLYPRPLGDMGLNGDKDFPYGARGPEPDEILPWVDDTTPYMEMELGTVVDTFLGTAGIHPHHQHVNSFQLIELETVPSYSRMSQATKDWFQNGDWHDLFQWPLGFIDGPNTIPIGPPCCCSTNPLGPCVPDEAPGPCVPGTPDTPPPLSCGESPGPPITTKIRFPLNQFGGRMVFHCHRLNHEDLGMIGFYQVNGDEGTLWDGAQDVNPECLLPKLQGGGGNTIVV
mmetsp:Transcript_18987/g.40036  ORF Transcript_18987/g.40036 Transcript_18987/m.40036 type:complete len:694 (+) Transcript_18987:35-2116(+)